MGVRARSQVNSPPANGRVRVEPSEGYALETPFTMTAEQWEDADLPLWYQVKYQVGPLSRSFTWVR